MCKHSRTPRGSREAAAGGWNPSIRGEGWAERELLPAEDEMLLAAPRCTTPLVLQRSILKGKEAAPQYKARSFSSACTAEFTFIIQFSPLVAQMFCLRFIADPQANPQSSICSGFHVCVALKFFFFF